MNDSKTPGARTASHNSVAVRAPRGTPLSCQGWEQEAALRLLMNSLDAELAERPDALIIRGGNQKAARDWNSYHEIVAAVRALSGEQTLVVDSGSVFGAVASLHDAPRVLLIRRGGAARQHAATAASTVRASAPNASRISESAAAAWIYVGPQGALPEMNEMFTVAALKHFGGSLAGRLVVTCGMGSAGAAAPLAATLQGGACLALEVSAAQLKKAVKAGYCEAMVNDLDEALRILKNAVRRKQPTSVGLVGNCAELLPQLASRGVVPDLLVPGRPVTAFLDASASDAPGNSSRHIFPNYVADGLTVEQAFALRETDYQLWRSKSVASVAKQAQGVLELQKLGSVLLLPSDLGEASRHANGKSTDLLTCIALSGDASDMARADRLFTELFATNEKLLATVSLLKRHVRFQGLPARVVALLPAERIKFALAVNDLVANGELQTPMLFGRVFADVPDRGRMFEDKNTTPAQLLAALPTAAAAATWVALAVDDQPGTETGTASRVTVECCAIVADGTEEAARRLPLVLGENEL